MLRQTEDHAGKFRSICIILEDIKKKVLYAETLLPDKFPPGEGEVLKMRLSEIVKRVEDFKGKL